MMHVVQVRGRERLMPDCQSRAPHHRVVPHRPKGAELMSCFPVMFGHIIANYCNLNISYYAEHYGRAERQTDNGCADSPVPKC